jgi:hypothetical protein
MKKALMFLGALLMLLSANAHAETCEQQALDDAKKMAKRLVNSQIMNLDDLVVIEKGDPGGFADCCSVGLVLSERTRNASMIVIGLPDDMSDWYQSIVDVHSDEVQSVAIVRTDLVATGRYYN